MVSQSSSYVELICPSEGISILCSNPNSWNTNPSAYRNKTLANVSSAIWQSTGNGSTVWHQTVFLLPRRFSYLYPLQKYKVNGVYLNIFQFRLLLTTISHPDPSSSFWTDLPASILSNPTMVFHPTARAMLQTHKPDHVTSFITFHHSDQSHSMSFPSPQGPLCSGHCCHLTMSLLPLVCSPCAVLISHSAVP